MAYRACFDEKRKYGIEIECYGLSQAEIVKIFKAEKISSKVADKFKEDVWVVGRDGTILDPHPLEIISPPLQGSAGFKQIDKVCDSLEKSGVQVGKSCGLHVHHEVTDYSGRSALNILLLYAKYEPVLDLLFDSQRRGDQNYYCRSLVKNGGTEWVYALNKPFFYQAYQIALEFEKTQKLDPVTSFPSARHHKVNLCAINTYKTIEFRQHEGTINAEEIKNWVVLSQQLISRAKDSIVSSGVATWDSLMRTLALTDSQLSQSVYTADKKILCEARNFFKERYRN